MSFALCLAALVVLWALAAAPSARADGDPASDVLVAQTLFLPQDAGVPQGQQAQIQRLLGEAAGRGYPIRVAVIASPTDLGSVAELWRQPASYAKFLGQELSLTYRGALLIVMPNGFGVFEPGRSGGALEATLSGVGLHPPGPGLGTTTLGAVTRLAAAAGHPLAVPRAGAPVAAGSSDIVPWIVFGSGVVAIALAWAASLRARPLNLSGRR